MVLCIRILRWHFNVKRGLGRVTHFRVWAEPLYGIFALDPRSDNSKTFLCVAMRMLELSGGLRVLVSGNTLDSGWVLEDRSRSGCGQNVV